MPSHPRVRDRQTQQVLGRALAFALDPSLAKYIERELSEAQLAVELVGTVRELVSALIEREPPRPQIMIADFDAMAPGEVLELHQIRDRWYGVVIAIGGVPEELRTSLNVEKVLDRSMTAGALRQAVAAVGLHRVTTKMTRID